MRLLLHLFGREVVDLEIGAGDAETVCDDRGSCASSPVGFVRDEAPPWEDPGRDHGYSDPS